MDIDIDDRHLRTKKNCRRSDYYMTNKSIRQRD